MKSLKDKLLNESFKGDIKDQVVSRNYTYDGLILDLSNVGYSKDEIISFFEEHGKDVTGIMLGKMYNDVTWLKNSIFNNLKYVSITSPMVKEMPDLSKTKLTIFSVAYALFPFEPKKLPTTLRVLEFSWYLKLDDIGDWIGDFKNLEVFKLNNTSTKSISTKIMDLKKLRKVSFRKIDITENEVEEQLPGFTMKFGRIK